MTVMMERLEQRYVLLVFTPPRPVFQDQLPQDGAGIPGVVYAAMVRSLHGQLQQLQRFEQTDLAPQPMQYGQEVLNVDMGGAKGVGDTPRRALLLKLPPVIIPVARPDSIHRAVFAAQDLAGVLKRDAVLDLGLRQRGKFGAKGTDLGMFWPDQQALLRQPRSGLDVQNTHSNLDNLCRLPFGRCALPTGGLDINDNQVIQSACQVLLVL